MVMEIIQLGPQHPVTAFPYDCMDLLTIHM